MKICSRLFLNCPWFVIFKMYICRFHVHHFRSCISRVPGCVISPTRARASMAMGQGDTPPQYIGTGEHYHECSPNISRVKSSCLYLLISWHFISPKRKPYFNVDKASGGLSPRLPTMAVLLVPAGGLPPLDSLLRPAMQPWRQIDATARGSMNPSLSRVSSQSRRQITRYRCWSHGRKTSTVRTQSFLQTLQITCFAHATQR